MIAEENEVKVVDVAALPLEAETVMRSHYRDQQFQIVGELRRLGFNVAEEALESKDLTTRLKFDGPDDLDCFFAMSVSWMSCDWLRSYEVGSVQIPRLHMKHVLTCLSHIATPTPSRLKAFETYAQAMLAEAETEGLRPDIRLSWVWAELNRYAKTLGPAYVQSIQAYKVD